VILSIHTALWNQTWQDDVSPFLDDAKRLGFDGAEISLLGDEAGFIKLANRAKELGLTLTATTGLGPDTDVGSADASVRRSGIDALRRAIRSTSVLGSNLLSGVLYGAWGVKDPDRREDRLAYAAEAISLVADEARDAGIVLGIEAINRYETDLINTAEQATEFVSSIGKDNVGVLLDAYHMNIEEKDPAQAIRMTRDSLVHLHVAGRDRGVPARADLDHAGILQALHDIAFDGVVTCEMFLKANVAVSQDLTVWRDIEPDPTEAARRAQEILSGWLQ